MINFIQPSLSCIVRNTQELGTRAVKTMLEIIEHSEESLERYPVISTQLVLRDTRIGKQGRHVRVMQMRTLFTSAPQMLQLFNRHSGRICLVRKP